MSDEFVVDASVFAKFYFHEEGSERARDFLTSGVIISVPDLVYLEMASIAAKRVRAKAETAENARQAVENIDDLLDRVVRAKDLAAPAYGFACDYGFSVYDGAYLALARSLSVAVVTADLRLVRRAEAAGLSHLVMPLTP
jgi:predicted nucleic acid-binding protein